MTVVPATPDAPDSLDSAIAQLLNLGERDPLTIARKLLDLRGGDWIADQLAAHWEEIITEIARQRIGSERRSTITSLSEFARKGKSAPKREVVLLTIYTPSRGYIAIGDATDADLAEAATLRRKLAEGLFRWADYFDALREQLQAQGVQRVRDLKGSLPELPRPDLAEIESA